MTADPTSVGALIVTFNEGQEYKFYSKTLTYSVDIGTCVTYPFTATQYPISLFGDLGTQNTVQALGFNYYDTAGASNCDCNAVTNIIQGDVEVTNLVAPLFATTDVMVDTSEVYDVVSLATGIDHFCGEY